MTMTPDGKRIFMTGGGGWRPPVEGGSGGGYFSAVFDTGNLQTMVGQAPGGPFAFHPVLNMGVAAFGGRELGTFNAKSFVQGQKILLGGGNGGPSFLTIGGKGTRAVLFLNGALYIIPLELKAEDRATLAKEHGKLPPPPRSAPN